MVSYGSLWKSITKAEVQTKRPAWVDNMVLELRESMRTIVELKHMLCMDLHTRLITLETNFDFTERGLREELNAMQMELIFVREHVSQLHQSLHTVPIQLRTLIKWVDIMEEQLEHVCDAIGQDLDEPVRRRDSDSSLVYVFSLLLLMLR
ncbi:hypothetical protein CJ030_MR3G001105 [Morella rubra]|uniref:Uncharacterized protein n=1 Tax=Morella rubra TaxID=262757 RepID=A0A6A1W2G9_9ROSI|nr:hypothetical protein CJ030_MR3G001105 [Morella rubra]